MKQRSRGDRSPRSAHPRSERVGAVAHSVCATSAAATAHAVAWCGAVGAEAGARTVASARHLPAALRAVNWAVFATLGRGFVTLLTVRWD